MKVHHKKTFVVNLLPSHSWLAKIFFLSSFSFLSHLASLRHAEIQLAARHRDELETLLYACVRACVHKTRRARGDDVRRKQTTDLMPRLRQEPVLLQLLYTSHEQMTGAPLFAKAKRRSRAPTNLTILLRAPAAAVTGDCLIEGSRPVR